MLKSYFDKLLIEAGCDEAGRGCLAGPVVCAAVILPKDFDHPFLNDSKQVHRDSNLANMAASKITLVFHLHL